MNNFLILAHGEDFDVDTYLASSLLIPQRVWHKGEGANRSAKQPTSGLEIILGDGARLRSAEQIQIATSFLEDNQQALRELGQYAGVDYFFLSIHERVELTSRVSGFVRPDYSAALMALALRVNIRLTTYIELIRPDSPIDDPSEEHETCSKVERDRLRAEFDRQFQLDDVHHTILSYLHFEPPRPTSEAAGRSRCWAKDTCRPVAPLEDYQRGIQELIEREVLWVVNDRAIQQIREYLDADPAIGPIDGIPEIGTLQVTVTYARLLNEFWLKAGIRRGVNSSRDWVSDEVARIYCQSAGGCLRELRIELEDVETRSAIQHISGPTNCGRWRCRWWEDPVAGYVLEIHYRSATERDRRST